MAEGPQVRLRTEWLHRNLAGRQLLGCHSSRADISAESLVGAQIQRAFCSGKHIFIEFHDGRYLHNHLLMRGRWRRRDGQLLFLPDGTWLGLYVGPYTVCNLNGQKLKLVDAKEAATTLQSLGPDAMSEPYPAGEIRLSLASAKLPVAEAILNQSLVAGIGNIAKSELLFMARIDPRVLACDLTDKQMHDLVDAVHAVLWQSYRAGGRWNCNIYQRQGKPCGRCGTSIRSLSQRPSNRLTYFCPSCQSVKV